MSRSKLSSVFAVVIWTLGLFAGVEVSTLRSERVHPAKHGVASGANFVDAAASTGLSFVHTNGATGKFYLPEIMGAGVALLDYDNDGDLDVFAVQGDAIGAGRNQENSPESANPQGNRLFRNDLIGAGQLHFTDVTLGSGLGLRMYGMGAAVGDYNNDGYADLYVTGFGRNALFRNNGDGSFADVTVTAGVDGNAWSASAAWLDYDLDGNLDLYVTNYVSFTAQAAKTCYAPTGEIDYCSPSVYTTVPGRLFHNEGNGKFRDVTAVSGVGKPGPGLGVVCFDYDHDGRMDLYVANDGDANRLWRNLGNGRFSDEALALGVAYGEDGDAQAGMGVDAADFLNHEIEGLVVTNLRYQSYNLYRNLGADNGFRDIVISSGLAQASHPYTGFGVRFFDYDNDGWLDLFVANGAVTRLEAQRGQASPFREPNQLYHSEEQGTGFRDVSASSGSGLQAVEVSRGVAVGDIDNDGDLDVIVSNNGGPLRLLINQTESNGHWLVAKLVGTRSNRMALGARVGVIRSGEPTLWRRVQTDGSYLSSSDSRVHFGLGASDAIEAIEVIWPDGKHERWGTVHSDSLVELREGASH